MMLVSAVCVVVSMVIFLPLIPHRDFTNLANHSTKQTIDFTNHSTMQTNDFTNYSAMQTNDFTNHSTMQTIGLTNHSTIEPEEQNATAKVQQKGERVMNKTHLKFYQKPNRTLTVYASDDEVLECQAGGVPPPRMYWLKDGEIITISDEILDDDDEDDLQDKDNSTKKTLGLGSTSIKLYLNCLGEEDIAKYTCVAKNPFHKITASSKLVFANDSDDFYECLKNTEIGEPPIILEWSKQRFEYIGNEVRFVCRSNGFPKPSVEWQGPENTTLPHDTDKYQLLPVGDLIVRDIQWSDMGVYVCIVTNIFGEDRTETFLYPTKL